VEIAFETLALGIARLDDARPRCAELVEPRTHFGL
jgi:hypothetical protein